MEFMDATLSDAVVYGGPLPERILAFVSDQMLRGMSHGCVAYARFGLFACRA